MESKLLLEIKADLLALEKGDSIYIQRPGSRNLGGWKTDLNKSLKHFADTHEAYWFDVKWDPPFGARVVRCKHPKGLHSLIYKIGNRTETVLKKAPYALALTTRDRLRATTHKLGKFEIVKVQP